MDIHAIQTALAQRYRVAGEIGRGGMATVYRATDLRHGRDVALKLLNDELLGPSAVDRFIREIDVTGKLTHPHILPLLDSGTVEGIPFYVMPLVSGETLRGRIARDGALAVPAAVALAAEIASALDFAHRHGVVHRDVKPENVLLQDGHAMVADFGIAKALSAAADGNALTATGVSIGTPAYMSPEQAAGDRGVDARSDVYALGCVLYEMLTGSPPFHGHSAQAVMARHASDPVPAIASVRTTVPREIERVVTRALAKIPADRFASAAEMREALLTASTPQMSASAPSRAPRAPVVVFGVLAMSLFVIVVATRGEDGRGPVAQMGAASAAATRIAVLPMANLSADTSDAYFAAGMTEELISTLSDIGGMQVMARGAVLRYADSARPLGDIGRELNVGSLIESSCRKEGNRLRISVRLVDAATQEQRWSRQYDRELTDAFAIQRDVARSVAQALRVELSGAETRALDRLPTSNPAAYEAYLRGRILVYGEVSPQSNAAAIEHLERAVALDTGFALAHATLAKAYVQQLFRFSPGLRFRNAANASIERALALDSSLAEAYLARADLAFTPEAGWRLDEALADYLHALSLKPGLAQAHGTLGGFLLHLGMPREALHELRLAVSLDPTDVFALQRIGRAFWYAQQYDSALAAYRGRNMGPEPALVLGHLRREREGFAFLDSLPRARGVRDVSGDDASVRAVLHARLGDQARALEEVRTVERSPGVGLAHFHHAQFNVAMAYAVLGDRDASLRWLEQAAQNGMPAYDLFLNDPNMASMRGYAPFEQFMQRQRLAWQARRQVVERAGIRP